MKCYDYFMTRFRLALAVVIGITLWLSRWAYVLPPDWPHLQDRFNHSQWMVSYSSRIISDNELYQVAAKALTQGADPFSINPEVPPLAKYLYGLSVILTGNPHWASLAYYGLTLATFYLLVKHVTQKTTSAQLATLALAMTPLFFYQLTQTMLDLPQTFFMLLHLLSCLKFLDSLPQKSKPFRQQSWWWLGLAGLSLGAGAAVKFPLIIPLLIGAEGWLFWRQRRLKWLVPVLALAFATYVLTYARYFALGHTPLEWLKAQKWMLNFYLISETTSYPPAFWSASLVGWHQGWWKEMGNRIGEWSLIWPLVTVVPLFQLLQDRNKIRHYSQPVVYILLIFLGSLVMFTLIPFWPRYFLTVLPLGLILTVPWLVTWPKWALTGLFLVFAIQALFFLRPQPTETLKFAADDWEKGNYQDLASYAYPPEFNQYGRADWARLLYEFDKRLTEFHPTVSLTSGPVHPWENHTIVHLKAVYPSHIREVDLPAHRYQNQWFIEGLDQLFGQ
jgi:4-amino-4-deoxy-L-arabinose transferase-like glycosyltransferase